MSKKTQQQPNKKEAVEKDRLRDKVYNPALSPEL